MSIDTHIWIGAALHIPDWDEWSRDAQEKIEDAWEDALMAIRIPNAPEGEPRLVFVPNGESECGISKDKYELSFSKCFSLNESAAASLLFKSEFEDCLAVLEKYGIGYRIVYGAFGESS